MNFKNDKFKETVAKITRHVKVFFGADDDMICKNPNCRIHSNQQQFEPLREIDERSVNEVEIDYDSVHENIEQLMDAVKRASYKNKFNRGQIIGLEIAEMSRKKNRADFEDDKNFSAEKMDRNSDFKAAPRRSSDFRENKKNGQNTFRNSKNELDFVVIDQASQEETRGGFGRKNWAEKKDGFRSPGGQYSQNKYGQNRAPREQYGQKFYDNKSDENRVEDPQNRPFKPKFGRDNDRFSFGDRYRKDRDDRNPNFFKDREKRPINGEKMAKNDENFIVFERPAAEKNGTFERQEGPFKRNFKRNFGQNTWKKPRFDKDFRPNSGNFKKKAPEDSFRF